MPNSWALHSSTIQLNKQIITEGKHTNLLKVLILEILRVILQGFCLLCFLSGWYASVFLHWSWIYWRPSHGKSGYNHTLLHILWGKRSWETWNLKRIIALQNDCRMSFTRWVFPSPAPYCWWPYPYGGKMLRSWSFDYLQCLRATEAYALWRMKCV